jgi:hypothetical protein
MFVRTVSAKSARIGGNGSFTMHLGKKELHLSPFQNLQVRPLSGRPPQAVGGDLGAVAAAALAPQVQADELRTGCQQATQPVVIHLVAGLAIKNPPKKTIQKTPKKPHKKPTKNVFFSEFF